MAESILLHLNQSKEFFKKKEQFESALFIAKYILGLTCKFHKLKNAEHIEQLNQRIEDGEMLLADLYSEYGIKCMLQDEPIKARKQFNLAIQIYNKYQSNFDQEKKEDFATLVGNCGIAYYREGNKLEAIKYISRSLKISDDEYIEQSFKKIIEEFLLEIAIKYRRFRLSMDNKTIDDQSQLSLHDKKC